MIVKTQQPIHLQWPSIWLQIFSLSQDQVLRLIKEANPTASCSKTPPSQLASSEWLGIRSPANKISRINGGNIAAVIGIHNNVVMTVTCFTNLRSNKCEEFFSVNSSDDLSAAKFAYIFKTVIRNFFLVPMLKFNIEALKLGYDNHNLNQNYTSNNKFGWSTGETHINQFSTNITDNKVVLTALSNIFATGFVSSLPQGDFDKVFLDIA